MFNVCLCFCWDYQIWKILPFFYHMQFVFMANSSNTTVKLKKKIGKDIKVGLKEVLYVGKMKSQKPRGRISTSIMR